MDDIQNLMKIEIEVKTNRVTFYPDQPEKVAEEQTVKVLVQQSKQEKKNSVLKDFASAFIKQVFQTKSHHTTIQFTRSAYTTMQANHVSKAIVKDVIRYPDYTKDGTIKDKQVKDARFYKFYSQDLIQVIAPYDPVKKTYVVLFVNKWKKK